MFPEPERDEMFCPNCGAALSNDAGFCGNCGQRLKARYEPPNEPSGPYMPSPGYGPYAGAPEKSELLSIILALLVPGSGHLYLGRLTRGLAILVAYFGLSAIAMIQMFNSFPGFVTGGEGVPMFDSGSIAFFIVIGAASLIIWVVQLVDAYNLTEQYNEALKRTGHPPW